MQIKYLSLLGIFVAAVGLSACGGNNAQNAQNNDTIVGYVSSDNFPDQRVEIYEFQPQFVFKGRGYSYASTLYDYDGGFDVLSLPLANADVRAAAESFCTVLDSKPSRFFAFTRAESGVTFHRMFFNCE